MILINGVELRPFAHQSIDDSIDEMVDDVLNDMVASQQDDEGAQEDDSNILSP